MKRVKTEEDQLNNPQPDNLTTYRIFTIISLICLVIALYSIPSNFGVTIIFMTLFLLALAYPRLRFGEIQVGELIGKKEPDEGWEQSGKEARENLRETFNRTSKSVTTSDIENTGLRKQVKDKQIEGWEIDQIDNSDEKVVMIGTEGGTVGGHALTAYLTAWSLGAGNVVYHKLSKRNNRERIVLRVDENDDGAPEDSDTDRDSIELLKDLKKLNDDEIISDEEFEKKKEDLLDEI